MPFANVNGVGLGLRRSLIPELMTETGLEGIDFFELAPENWVNLGGRYKERLQWFVERKPLVSHGLSLNLGGQDPLDTELLNATKQFLDDANVVCFSEHLSFSRSGGQLYDLLPMPFTDEAVMHVSKRIRQVQEHLERSIAIENISYYLAPFAQMTEIEFINAVLVEADCQLLLDINNVYVNSINHRYDPLDYLSGIPQDRIAYSHIAGHSVEAEDLRVDTHGAPIIDSVYDLARRCYERFGAIPTLLERDFNIPSLGELKDEIAQVRACQEVAHVVSC